MKKLLSEVIEEIKPDREYEEQIFIKANSIIKKINSGLKNARAVLGGSGAKGTWLKSFDADIFVKFNYKKFKDKSDVISDILEKFLKKHFKIKRFHGSRDYFQIKQDKFTFEIIPILDIKKAEQAKNITDVSPLHSDFVLRHRNRIDDIRLTKQFFKAARAYGAESHIRGFSGYVCELLAIYYGSFLNLVKAMEKWQERTVIDINNYYKGKDVFLELNKSKLTSPLVIIDPVQKDRNAAAALDREKFNIARHRSREFLRNPTKDFFSVKVPAEKDIIQKFSKYKVALLKAEPLDKKTDVAGAKMLKAFHFIENTLISHGFKLIESDMLWDGKGDSLLYFVLENAELPKTIELSGPPLKIAKHAEIFRKKHKKTFVKGSRIFAIEKRKHTDAYLLIKSLMKTQNVRDNVKKIR